MYTLDARGLECPAPVIKTKEIIENCETDIKILVDNIASKENVERFLKSKGFESVTTKSNNHYEIVVDGTNTCGVETKKLDDKVVNKVLYISNDKVGSDEKLGKILLKGFIHTLKEADQIPNKIIFVNRAVFVTTEWSDSIEDLLELKEMGIDIYSCGTCLNYYEVTEKLKVGVIGNAYDTVNFLSCADSVIKF